jgi:pimeloyl-ACP methyl ester carboxylesterase
MMPSMDGNERKAPYAGDEVELIPGLFLPGNAGSRSQGRSIASELARIARRSNSPVALTIHVVDFSEELSALDARTVARQASFVAEVMQFLHRPGKPLFVIAHSMGARLAVAGVPLLSTTWLGPESGDTNVGTS